jgi:hypothetical protein
MAAPGEKSFCVLEYHSSKSVVTVQRAFRAKYAKDPPTDKTIRVCYKQFTETGCLCKQKSSGRSLTAEDVVKRVRASFRATFLHSPKKRTGTAGNELSMSKTTPLSRDLTDLKARIIAAVKNIDAPMLTHVWQELEYHIDLCRVTRGAHIEHL